MVSFCRMLQFIGVLSPPLVSDKNRGLQKVSIVFFSSHCIESRSSISRLTRALDLIDRKDFYFNSSSFASLLQICGNLKLLQEGKRLHRHLENIKLRNDPYIASFLIQMYVKCDHFRIAQDLFMNIEGKSAYLCNYMIGAFAKHGLIHESRYFFDQMMLEGIAPDRVTCVNVICLYAGHGSNLEQGRRLHSCLFYLGFHQDCVVSTSLISFYGKHGNLEEAMRMHDGMDERNVVSWNSLLGVFSQDMFVERFLQSFEQILQEGLLPDRITFISIISGCAEKVLLSAGKIMHARIAHNGIEIDVKVASALINMYGKCGEIEDSKYIFDVLPNRNLFCWNTMIGAYVQRGFFKEALELLYLMKQKGITPDKVTLVSILSIYARGGQLEDVRCIFEGIPDCNVIYWNAIITALAQQGNDKKVFEYFKQMQLMEITADEVTFCNVLLSCTNQLNIGLGKRLHIQIVQFGYDMDLYVSNSLINLYGKCGNTDEASSVFQSLLVCDVVTWNTMITAHSRHGKLKDALRMFDQMQSESVMPDKVTFLSILEAIQGHLSEGKRIHAMIIYSGFRSEDAIVTTLISMYGKCESLDVAQRLFNELSEKTNAAWNAIISLCVQQGQGMHALQLFDEMLQIGVIPNHVTYVSCLGACASLCVLGKGKHIYTQMIHSELGSNVLLGTALVNLYSRCGKLVDAQRVFDEMLEHDVISFNVIIAAYAQHGCGKVVVEIFYQMLKEGFVPDSTTFTHTLSACSHAGLVDDGRHIFQLMKVKYGINPSLEHYDCMIDLLSRAGCLEEVDELVIRMPFKPSLISWTAVLGSCSDVKMGNRVAHSMLEIDPMCCSSYVTLSNIYTSVSGEDTKTLVKAKSSKSLKRKSYSYLRNNELMDRTLHGLDTVRPLSTTRSKISKKMETPGTELTLALIKPDAVQAGHVETIMHAMEMHGFVIVTYACVHLTRVRAEEFYDHSEGSDSFEKLCRFISSGNIHAYVLGKKDAIQEWSSLIGPMDPDVAQKESPSSLRALYGTDLIRNAVHGSSSRKEANREISFFFPSVMIDPLPNEAMAREYFDKHMKTTLLKGLTALAKAKPHSDPLEVITWLAVWLQENNPNKPLVNGARVVVGL